MRIEIFFSEIFICVQPPFRSRTGGGRILARRRRRRRRTFAGGALVLLEEKNTRIAGRGERDARRVGRAMGSDQLSCFECTHSPKSKLYSGIV